MTNTGEQNIFTNAEGERAMTNLETYKQRWMLLYARRVARQSVAAIYAVGMAASEASAAMLALWACVHGRDGDLR